MRMTVEREIRVEGLYYGTVYSVVAGKIDPSEPLDIMNVSAGMRLIYGYVLTEDGEEQHLVSVDFGFEHIQGAVNACMAAVLRRLYRVYEQANVLSLD